jgi:spore germination protein GerM
VSRRRAAVLLGILSLAVLAAGCGIDPQAAPEVLDVDPLPPATAEVTDNRAGPRLVLWFVEGGRLVPVERSAAEPDPATALDLLAEGLTAEEAAAGLTTAITEQPLTVAEQGADDVLVVEVTPAFTGVAGADQLTAVAQVVWTVTGFDGVDAVRFATDDSPLEVPTDAGLGSGPVDRDDYSSLAPA